MGRIHFGCRDDIERQSWVEWMVRGTGQNFQPQQLGAEEVVKGTLFYNLCVHLITTPL